jgi:hypothetical protein
VKNHGTASEFEWEEIFREDDSRIRKYMDELPRFIHVPGEDEITIGEDPPPENPFLPEQDEDDEGDSGENTPDWRDRKGAEIMKKLLCLSRAWMLVHNAALSGAERRMGFKATTLLAMASGRLMASVNFGEENPDFAIAHCKRMRGDLSDAEAVMRRIMRARPEFRRIVEEQISALAEISEMVSDRIFELRGSKKQGSQP